jgi:hypothetical protein
VIIGVKVVGTEEGLEGGWRIGCSAVPCARAAVTVDASVVDRILALEIAREGSTGVMADG